MQYWTIVNNVKVGPMNAAQLIAYGINPNSLVWCEGMAQWTQACRVPELMPYFRSTQPVNNFRPCPSTYFPWAIVTTLLCCFPAGIIALIYSTMVESRYSRGDYYGSVKASETALLWCIIALVFGLVSWPFALFFNFPANYYLF